MSRRRSQVCCCGDEIYLTDCNAWQQACFGESDPNDFPQSCALQLSGSMSYIAKCSCDQGASTQSVISLSATVSMTGTRELGNWGQQGGVRYALTGNYQYSLSETHSICDCGVCYSFAVSSAGSCSGVLQCGSCQFPTPQAPCGSFSAPFYRGWGFQIDGAQQTVPLTMQYGDCCGGKGTVETSFEEAVGIAGQLDACSTSRGCQQCPAIYDCNGVPLYPAGRMAFGPNATGILLAITHTCTLNSPDFYGCSTETHDSTVSLSFS